MAARTAGTGPQRLTAPERRQIFTWAREITANRQQLARRWTARLEAGGTVALPPGGAPAPSEHLAEGGGFQIPALHTNELGSAAGDFFTDMVIRDGWAYPRGFGYYGADEQMYRPGRAPSAARRWALVEKRWGRYADFARPIAAGAAADPSPWYRWLGWLAFVEAAVNDACTARWTASALGWAEAEPVLDEVVEGLCALLAEAAWNRWQQAGPCEPSSWGDRTAALVAAPEVTEVLRGLGGALLPGPPRRTRYGRSARAMSCGRSPPSLTPAGRRSPAPIPARM